MTWRAIAARPDLELLSQNLSIVTFRFVPMDLRPTSGHDDVARYLDSLNEALLERLQVAGHVFVSNAVVNGRFALRACIVNFNTTAADVEALPPIVARAGLSIDRERRA